MIKRNNLFHYYKIFIVKSKNAFSRLPPYKAYNQKHRMWCFVREGEAKIPEVGSKVKNSQKSEEQENRGALWKERQ